MVDIKNEWWLWSNPISEKMPLHFGSRTPTFGFIARLVELNVMAPKNKKLFRSDEKLRIFRTFD